MPLRPLGSFERALLLTDLYSPFNVVAVLQLESPPPSELVRQALGEMQRRHPFLRICIEDPGHRPHFEEMDHPVIPLAVAPRSSDDHWLAAAQFELNQHLDISKGPLFRCSYLFHPSRAELIFTLHHTIADAASILYLLHELLTRCESLAGNTLPASLPELQGVPPVEARFPAAFRGLGRLQNIFGYAARQIRDELRYQIRSRSQRVPSIHLGAHTQILSMELSPSLTDALIRRARREKVTLNSLLNAALVLAVNRQLDNGRSALMRTISFPDLRPYVAPPLPTENLGAYISMLRYTLEVREKQAVWELARDLHQRIYVSLKRGDKFTASLMSEGLMKMLIGLKSMRMASTALSYTGVVDLSPQYGSIRVRGLHGFISNVALGPEYTAQVSLFADRLIWDIVYLDQDMERAQALAIADEIRAILASAL